MREARFTVSPITVYSLRRGEPTLPATTLPRCRPMPMRNGQSLPAFCSSIGDEHLARRGDGTLGRLRIVERRAEQCEEAVAEKLVHDAAVAIDDLDQDREGRIQSLNNLLRRAHAGGGRKAANVDKHDGNAAGIAFGRRTRLEQTLDDLRRDVLAKQVGHVITRRGGGDAGFELPAQLRTDRTRDDAAGEDHGAARYQKAVAKVGSPTAACAAGCRNASPSSSALATKPVKADSQKSSRNVERMMNTK